MADPKLKRTTVGISMSCDDGYKSDKRFLSKLSPEQGMIAAIRELTGMAYLYGYGEHAADAFHEAKEAVEKFHSERSTNPKKP